MIYEYLSLILGILKILLYKLLYISRIYFNKIPKINANFKIAIKRGSKLLVGDNFRARNNVSFRIYNSGKIKIGNNCFFNDNCSINCQKSIIIGNNVIFGQNVMLFDHDHDYKNNINDFICSDIVIGNNVWIGANCIILKGVVIGDNAVIAAGTVVRDNIKSRNLYFQKKHNISKSVDQ